MNNGFWRRAAILMLIITAFTLCSCGKTERKIIIGYPDAESAFEACGIDTVEFLPQGFTASAYRTVYGIVCETEFTCGEEVAVMRIADSVYTVSNLSGYTDTALKDVYTAKNGREFEIEERDGVYAVEFSGMCRSTLCNVSYVLHGGSIAEFTSQLEAISAYFPMQGDAE